MLLFQSFYFQIISPRPWKGSDQKQDPIVQPKQELISLSSGVSAASSRAPTPKTPKSVIEEDHSYYCSSPDVNDEALLVDERVVDGVKIRTKSSTKNAIKLTLQKNLHNDRYSVQEMLVHDGSKNKNAFKPQAALKALKAKTQRKKLPRPHPKASFITPLNKGQICQSQDQFVNEVLPMDQGPKIEAVKLEPESESDSEDEEIIYELTSEDGFKATSSDINKLWMQVLEAVKEARLLHGLDPLSATPSLNTIGLQMLGLTHSAVMYLVEQLPGKIQSFDIKLSSS